MSGKSPLWLCLRLLRGTPEKKGGMANSSPNSGPKDYVPGLRRLQHLSLSLLCVSIGELQETLAQDGLSEVLLSIRLDSTGKQLCQRISTLEPAGKR